MLGDRGFFGPAQYPHFLLYLAVGFGLLLLIGAWYVFVVRFTRRRFPRATLASPPSPASIRKLQVKYAGLIAEVEREFHSGGLSEREVNSRLSLLVRFFVYETSGVDAQVMTLDDLRGASVPGITEAVADYYPVAFEQERHGDPAEAISTAREVIATWA